MMFTFLLRSAGIRPAHKPQQRASDNAHLRAMVEAIGGDPDDIVREGARD